jgi:hypothetical protein
MTCKQFIESGDDEITMVLTGMDGWYKGDQDQAIIDTDVFVANAKKIREIRHRLRDEPDHRHRQCRRKDSAQLILTGQRSQHRKRARYHRHRLVVGSA